MVQFVLRGAFMSEAYLDFPKGEKVAITSSRGKLTFSDLHHLRGLIRKEVSKAVPGGSKRILGCLQDDADALLALLFLTEITDYMPINPALSDMETLELQSVSGADIAFVSRAIFASKGHVFSQTPVVIWDDIVTAALTNLRSGQGPSSDPIFASQGRLILHTSGSTGMPKRVPISIASMNASALNIAKGHQLQDDDHALNALPTFHIGALVDVMLAPFAAGGSISITNQRSPDGLVQALIDQRPTWIQVVPTLLRRLVEDIDPAILSDAGLSLRFVRSISAPVPQDLKQQVEKVFGCPVIEMYGMTETAGQIATVSRNLEINKTGSVGIPVGVDVAIMDRYGNPLRNGQAGEVCVKGPTVFNGYEASAQTDVFFEEWFRTGDLGKQDDDGNLFLQGRLKEMVNVGGEKVSPHEIEMAVLTLPDVIEAAAYSLPHPSLGEQVGLTVASRVSMSSEDVKAYLDQRLASFKCPNRILIVDQLPRLANAKVDRLLLKRTAQADWEKRQSTSCARAHEVQSPLERTVALHWSRILKCRPPVAEDDFFDMGGDSLSATQFLLSLEKSLGHEISPNQLFDAPTFASLVVALSDDAKANKAKSARPIRYIQENTAGWPGQCVVENGLLRSLGSLKPDQPLFWASQAQLEIDAISETIGKRRAIYVTGSLFRFKRRTEKDFEIVAQQLADEISLIQPKGPIALGGFCGGAWIMHHTAERLRQSGREIRVFVSFDYWPSRPIPYPSVHCMSTCRENSGRIKFPRYDLADRLLHPKGAMAIHIESEHEFNAQHIAPHLAELNAILNGEKTMSSPPSASAEDWPLNQRKRAPEGRIRFIKPQRFYSAGETARIEVEVTNISSEPWPKSELSGLSVKIDLLNLDGYARAQNVALGLFDADLPAGARTIFSFDITFPNRKIPMWVKCSFASQGILGFQERKSTSHKSLIFPRLSSAPSGHPPNQL